MLQRRPEKKKLAMDRKKWAAFYMSPAVFSLLSSFNVSMWKWNVKEVLSINKTISLSWKTVCVFIKYIFTWLPAFAVSKAA